MLTRRSAQRRARTTTFFKLGAACRTFSSRVGSVSRACSKVRSSGTVASMYAVI